MSDQERDASIDAICLVLRPLLPRNRLQSRILASKILDATQNCETSMDQCWDEYHVAALPATVLSDAFPTVHGLVLELCRLAFKSGWLARGPRFK